MNEQLSTFSKITQGKFEQGFRYFYWLENFFSYLKIFKCEVRMFYSGIDLNRLSLGYPNPTQSKNILRLRIHFQQCVVFRKYLHWFMYIFGNQHKSFQNFSVAFNLSLRTLGCGYSSQHVVHFTNILRAAFHVSPFNTFS